MLLRYLLWKTIRRNRKDKERERERMEEKREGGKDPNQYLLNTA